MLSLPKSVQPNTYTVTADEENRIESIDLLAFKVLNGQELFSYHVKGMMLATDGVNGKVTFYADLLKSKEEYRFVIICNARAELERALDSFIEGKPKDDMLPSLIKLNTQKWKSENTSNFKPFPMWGEAEVVKGIDALTSNINFNVIRSLAAIDVVLGLSASLDFEMTSVGVFNANNCGQIVPFPSHYNVQQEAVSQESLPDLAQYLPVQDYESSKSFKALKNEIYLFESKAAQSAFAAEATGLVIGGKYQGIDPVTYYRIDIVDANGKPIPLLRNHRYTLNIVKVNGRGVASKELAWNTKPVNIKVSITQWSEGNLGDVDIPESYELKVGQEFFQDDGGRKRVNINLNATHSRGWTVSSSANWISPVLRSGPAGTEQKFSFNLSGNYSGVSRTGTLTFKSGILSKTLRITQAVPNFVDNLPGLDIYVAKTDLRGNYNWYRAVNVEEGSISTLDPLEIQVDPARTGSCKQVYGEGWRLPTYDELTRLLPYQYDKRNAIERALRGAGATIFDQQYFYWTGTTYVTGQSGARALIINANPNASTLSTVSLKTAANYLARCVKSIPLE
ncbi:FimB/Mfa2 family fimbrial subunit [Pedobacter sp. N36a]|nr:BACON domain-containing carbohydrate-binding protein [Pedobacter sp. N36a]MBC8986317.1 FimB/Mfa2 family fimbrial subunit [Pedobacter sp. N36a]